MFLAPFCAHADIALETETGDPGKEGEDNFSQGIQFDKYHGGRTIFLLTQFEYAMTDESEILVEPFFCQWMRNSGSRYQGIGISKSLQDFAIVLKTPPVWEQDWE